MKYLIILIVSLIAAVVLGQLIANDAGFVVIGYGGKVLRTSFVFFAVLLIATVIAAYLIWRLLHQLLNVGSRWRGWRGNYKRKRSHRALSNGLIALAEGNYTKAENLLSRSAADQAEPAIHYIGAAEAADALNAPERRDSYLSLAREAMPGAEVAIGVKRAQMQLAHQQPEQARATLEYLADRHPDNTQVLGLQQRVYAAIDDNDAQLTLLPALRRHRVYDDEHLKDIEGDTAVAMLSQPLATLEEVDQVWRSLPKSTREQAGSLDLYTERLTALGFDEQAEKLLRKHLNRDWDAALILRYGMVRIENASLQLERAEAWLIGRPDDADLLMCLARLSIAAQDWEKAATYLHTLTQSNPSPLAYQLLGEVHEHNEDLDAAHRCHREGLRLATGGAAGLPAVVTSYDLLEPSTS